MPRTGKCPSPPARLGAASNLLSVPLSAPPRGFLCKRSHSSCGRCLLISRGIMFSRFIRVAARILPPCWWVAAKHSPPQGSSSLGSRPEVPSRAGRSLQNTGNSYVLDSMMSTPNCFTHREMTIHMFTMSEYKHDLVSSMEKRGLGWPRSAGVCPAPRAAGSGSLITGSGPPRGAGRGGPGRTAPAPRGIAAGASSPSHFVPRRVESDSGGAGAEQRCSWKS